MRSRTSSVAAVVLRRSSLALGLMATAARAADPPADAAAAPPAAPAVSAAEARAAAADGADASALDLDWRSSEPGCEGTGVASEALRLLALPPQRRVSATAQVWRDGEEWIVQLDTRSAVHSGRRVLRSQSCQDLRQALALLLAMILETEADPEGLEPTAESVDTPVVPPLAPKPSGVRFLMQAGGGAGHGLKPGLAWGFGGGAGLQWRRWEAWLRFTHWPVTRAPIADSAGDVEIERENLALAVCRGVDLGVGLELVPCLSPELTLFGSRAVGITDAEEANVKPLVSLTGTVDLRYWLPGQWLFAAIGAGATLEMRQAFRIRYACEPEEEPECPADPPAVYTTGGLGPRFSFAVGARF